VSANTTLFGPASTISSVQTSARELGYSISLYSLSNIDIKEILVAVDELLHSGVDGLILNIPTSISLTQLKSAVKGSPVILLENENDLDIPSVNVDQYQGARLAVRHLIDNGHRQIAHIAGPQDWFDAKRRYQGWRDELKQFKLASPPMVKGDWSAESGYFAMRELSKKNGITAVFVANDAMALGALKFLSEKRINVPGELSIVGFDDISESSFFIPSLTTVKQDFHALGTAAIDLLMSNIRGEKIPNSRIYIEPTLIERRSVSKFGN
jgi:DNA-binding LacI/PurR family transcriptional regulator